MSQEGELSLGGVWKNALGIFKARFWGFVGLAAISQVFVLALVALTSILENKAYSVTFGLLALLMTVVGIWLLLKTQLAMFVLAHNTSLTIREALRATKGKVYQYILLSLLLMLVYVGAFVLFVIPVIYIIFSTVFCMVILAVEGDSNIKALQKSREYVRGRWWKVFGYIITLALGVIVIGVLLDLVANISNLEISSYVVDSIVALFTGPLIAIFLYAIYQKLRESRPDVENVVAQKKKIGFVALAILGLIAPIIAMSAAFAFGPQIIKQFQDRGYFVESQEATVIVDEDNGISFTVPAGFLKIPNPNGVHVYAKEDAVLIVNIKAIDYDIQGSGQDITEEISLDKFKEIILAGNERGDVVESATVEKIDGVQVYKAISTLKEAVSYDFIFIQNGKEYLISLLGEIENREQVEVELKEIIDSVDIK